ncbi:AraC family transcriptional regulator [Xenorhabdus miraniensis]|uniref:Type III secretion system transcriptional regulator BsaN n=1 Tax=Xenorhabdus miraniensis TaxID=351674 RepID=A0A2D0JX22_9GAMM|nr:AraC family transcriptional regulator [Xenorhabdus miraniensis]PHM50932.1 type III secretion system transcriptional regulator BsaN [Xenorhabdus miraniensis]
MRRKIDRHLEAVRLYEYHKQYLVLSHNMKTEWHRHPCIQLSVSYDYSQMKIDTEQGSQQAYGFIIAGNIKHRLHSENKSCFHFLIDPAHSLYHLLLHQMKNADIIYLKPDSARLIADYFIHCLQSDVPPNILALNNYLNDIDDCHCSQDTRIIKATTLITELPVKSISSSKLSGHLFLSESRFLHLFRQEMGTNFRGYLLWKRFHHALEKINSPDSLTLLAAHSGFSDSAHFSRTGMMLYGFSPSELKNASMAFSDICLRKISSKKR